MEGVGSGGIILAKKAAICYTFYSFGEKESRKRRAIMGFLSRLFGKKEKALDGTYRRETGSSGGYGKGSASDPHRAAFHSDGAAFDPDDEDCWEDMNKVRRRVERVMNEEWCAKDSSYEIRRELGMYDMGWSELAGFQPPKNWRGTWKAFYAYGLFRAGQPVAMVLLLPNNTCYNRSDVAAFHRACERRGIFCMNLIPRLPNRYTYIRERLTGNVRL